MKGVLITFEDGTLTLLSFEKFKLLEEIGQLPEVGSEVNTTEGIDKAGNISKTWVNLAKQPMLKINMITPYGELLKSTEWREKRKKIIERDKYLCQSCSNENVIKDCSEGKAKKIYNHLYGFPIEIIVEGWGLGKAFISEDGLRIIPEETKVYYYLDDQQYIKTLAFKNLNTDKYIYVPSLHVHHKYYQEGLKPWEYPDSALITYCWVCHEKLHATTQVPKLDTQGNEIGKLTPCMRCAGAGIFPEFRHIQAGICFRCNGACYEELIIVE